MKELVGDEVAVASFVNQGAYGVDPVSYGKRVGPIVRARVVRATRSFVTFQRWACGGWHTGVHGKFTTDWGGVERRKADRTIHSRVWPAHMAWLRIRAKVIRFELGFIEGRIV
jgi:hypothetical protein